MNYLKNKSFQKALRNAAGMATNPAKISDLLEAVGGKLSNLDKSKKQVATLFDKVKTLMRMLRAYVSGEYREMPWKSLLMIIGALVYFLMPVDLIPDFIPVSGLADDLSILFLVYNSVNEDIAGFLEFEKTKNSTGSGARDEAIFGDL